MPSHFAHYIFARDLLNTLPETVAKSLNESCDSFLALGAQGPDIFLHNRHRRPAGLNYGIILHRKNSGLYCASLIRQFAHKPIDSPSGAFTLGSISHVVLDRLFHPYINFRAGWVEPKQPQTYSYRVNHPFLERIIDVKLLESRWGMTPNEFDFAHRVNCDTRTALPVLHAVRRALRAATRRGRNDMLLGRRIKNAYLDAMDYYRHTNSIDYARATREIRASEEELPFWLGIYHPPVLPPDIDFMNDARAWWRHPCSGNRYSNESVYDLYDRALSHGRMLYTAAYEAWYGSRPKRAVDESNETRELATGSRDGYGFGSGYDAHGSDGPSGSDDARPGVNIPTTAPGTTTDPLPPHGLSVERLVGNGDLSDERIEGEPCERKHFEVLDFERTLRHIRSYVLERGSGAVHDSG